MQPIVLRKIAGRFDACRKGASFHSGGSYAAGAPNFLGTMSAFLRVLMLPLLILVVIAAAVAFPTAIATHVSLAALPIVSAPARRRRVQTERGIVTLERKDTDPATQGIGTVKAAVEALGRTFEEFKKANDERIAELKSKGSADATLVEKVEKLNVAISEISALKAKMEAIETKAARPKLVDAKGNEISSERVEHRKAFAQFLKKGIETGLLDLQQKALSVGSDPDGGYAVPVELDRAIVDLAVNVGAIRRLATARTVGTPNYEKLVNIRGTSSGWVGETDARGATNTPQLKKLTPYMGEIYANPQATQQSLDDMFFDAEQWLAENVGVEFSGQEGQSFIDGDGTNKPRGFLDYTMSLNGDATRTFGEIQYFKTGQAATLRTAPDTADDLLDLIHAMKKAYRAGASFLTNSLTVSVLRKVKDGNDRYIWEPSTQAGQPGEIFGYAVEEDEGMPDVGANAFPIALANWKLAYEIVDRIGTRVIRDNLTNKPYVGFYTTKRVGGHVVNSEAIKTLKCSA